MKRKREADSTGHWERFCKGNAPLGLCSISGACQADRGGGKESLGR